MKKTIFLIVETDSTIRSCIKISEKDYQDADDGDLMIFKFVRGNFYVWVEDLWEKIRRRK